MMAFNLAKGLLWPKEIIRASFSSITMRPSSFKSAITLESLYPSSSLKLTTPSFEPDPKEKFSGFIPMDKIKITYSASSGPGGQNVNKVHTKVDVRFKVSEADWLHSDIREKLADEHKSKITKEGFLVIRSDVTRSQQLNLANCLNKLRDIIRKAAEPVPQPSKITLEKIRKRQEKAARERLFTKRENSLRREMKQPPTVVDL